MAANTGDLGDQAPQVRVPRRFNLATDLLERHDPERPAAIDARAGSEAPILYTYGDLDQLSNRLANWLYDQGVLRGDRVAVCLDARPETLAVLMACGKMAVIAVPLSTALGVEATRHRLREAGAKLVVTDAPGRERLRELVHELPALLAVANVDDVETRAEIATADLWCSHELTDADEPALLIFTPGTAAAPRGVVHGHRAGFGHLASFEALHDGVPEAGDRLWTDLDWTSFAGFVAVLWPALYLGVPVVITRMDPDADPSAGLATLKVRNLAVTPGWLARSAELPSRQTALQLRSLAVMDGALAPGLAAWAEGVLGVPARQAYDTVETGVLLTSPATKEAASAMASAVGRGLLPVPGHRVALSGQDGDDVPVGGIGMIRLATPDPLACLGFWEDGAVKPPPMDGSWLSTGDLGRREPDGGIRVLGTPTDLIVLGDKELGAVEVEQLALGHPRVVRAAAVQVDDDDRPVLVVAIVTPNKGALAETDLAHELGHGIAETFDLDPNRVEVRVRPSLPVNAAGRVLRRDVRAIIAVEREEETR